MLETVLLSIYNHDSAIAAAASRMITAAGGRPCIEMGSRRTQELAAVAAARVAYIAGFDGHLESGGGPSLRRTDPRDLGALVHAAARERGRGVRRPDRRARRGHHAAGGHLRRDGGRPYRRGTDAGPARRRPAGLRATSACWRRQVRELLDSLGARQTKIVVTSDLDEYAIAALSAAPVDSYGVGTALVTGSGHPTSGFVYKLVARAETERAGRRARLGGEEERRQDQRRRAQVRAAPAVGRRCRGGGADRDRAARAR